MSAERVDYTPRQDATPETEVATLASVYKFVLDTAKKSAAGVTSTNGGEQKGSRNDLSAKNSIP